MDFYLQFDVFAQFTNPRAHPLQMLRKGVKFGGEDIGVRVALGWLGRERVRQRAKNKDDAQGHDLASSWGHEPTLSEGGDRPAVARLVSS